MPELYYRPRKNFSLGKFIFRFLLVIILAGGAYWFYNHPSFSLSFLKIPQLSPAPDAYAAFTDEVYDKIKENYWDKISDQQLAKLFKLAGEKLSGQPASSDPQDKAGVLILVKDLLKNQPDQEKKKDFLAKLVDVVAANLEPFGRSRLYTGQQTKDLKNTVVNIDPKSDLYAALGVSTSATTQEIDDAYQKKAKELADDKSPEAAEKLAKAGRAKEALGTADKKKKYDQDKTEPTVTGKLLRPDIFYLKLSKFSPQSFEELQTEANKIDPKKKDGPTTLIFDLRGNLGGAIDILTYFLGPFIGPDQYAYEFFHQGEKTPFKTKVGWLNSLVRYKKTVILIDEKSQSSAEVMAATLKKYNVGVLLGTTTRGWGTVEMVYPIENQLAEDKLSLLLAHSLTLREDGQAIESKGVEPHINIKDPDWDQQLTSYFNYPDLVKIIKMLY